jgi:hypothetical protein
MFPRPIHAICGAISLYFDLLNHAIEALCRFCTRRQGLDYFLFILRSRRRHPRICHQSRAGDKLAGADIG